MSAFTTRGSEAASKAATTSVHMSRKSNMPTMRGAASSERSTMGALLGSG